MRPARSSGDTLRSWFVRAPASIRALPVFLALSAQFLSPASSSAAPRTLTAVGLFDSLAMGEAHAYRLEGEGSARCDSMILTGGTSLDCFAIIGEIPIRTYMAMDILLHDLSKYPWLRAPRGWTWPVTPTIGFTIRTDSAEVGILLSLRTMRATMSAPGEGTVACELPNRDYRELAWCIWGLDRESAEVQPFIRNELTRHGLDPGKDPPDDFASFLITMLEPERGREEDRNMLPVQHARPGYDCAHPQYPAFALGAGIEGTVVLRVHVDRDGHPLEIRTLRSVAGLDMAARAAVSLWSFYPATQGGERVEDWVDVDVPFSLREELERLRPHRQP